jgi:hypothetical protein
MPDPALCQTTQKAMANRRVGLGEKRGIETNTWMGAASEFLAQLSMFATRPTVKPD